ncbi:unnamed protein product [Closterium sp. Yama58-4]|nr:unnamed protein product [Closterium sp. Yama58-4]
MALFSSGLPLQGGGVGLQILLAASSSSIVIRAANLVVGVGFPVFRSFKAIEEGSQADRNRCLAYWSVYGCFRVVETITDRIISWLPFYQHIKLLLLLWLQLPSTSSSRPATGAGRLYASHLRPVLLRYRRHIDGALVSIDRCMASWFHAHQEELSAAARMAQSATRAALTALDSAVSAAAAALPPPAADGPPAATSAVDSYARNGVTDDVSGSNRDGAELHDRSILFFPPLYTAAIGDSHDGKLRPVFAQRFLEPPLEAGRAVPSGAAPARLDWVAAVSLREERPPPPCLGWRSDVRGRSPGCGDSEAASASPPPRELARRASIPRRASLNAEVLVARFSLTALSSPRVALLRGAAE